jgi:hypothetical protein
MTGAWAVLRSPEQRQLDIGLIMGKQWVLTCWTVISSFECVCVVLRLKPRTSHVQGKPSNHWATSPALECWTEDKIHSTSAFLQTQCSSFQRTLGKEDEHPQRSKHSPRPRQEWGPRKSRKDSELEAKCGHHETLVTGSRHGCTKWWPQAGCHTQPHHCSTPPCVPTQFCRFYLLGRLWSDLSCQLRLGVVMFTAKENFKIVSFE